MQSLKLWPFLTSLAFATVLYFPTPAAPRATVAIVGAGASGLYAAYLLKKAGVDVLIFEGSDHIGGRMTSRPSNDNLNLIIDEGLNLVSNGDHRMIALLREFDIAYMGRVEDLKERMNYIFGGRVYTQAEANDLLFARNRKALTTIHDHQTKWWNERNKELAHYLLHTDVKQYLRDIGADALLIQMAKVFFWSEYGRRLDEINAEMFYEYFMVDLEERRFEWIPYYDEAYTIPGGAAQIITGLANFNRDRIHLQNRVTGIERIGEKMRLDIESPQGAKSVEVDYVLNSAPSVALQDMRLNVRALSNASVQQVAHAGHAHGLKIHLKFKPGFNDIYKYGGIYLTDTGEQIWVSSHGQNTDAGLITVLTGPIKNARIESYVRNILLKQLEIVAPGIRRLFAGFEVTFTDYSYSGARRPGEPANLQINEQGFTRYLQIGELVGGENQGYGEGALEGAETQTQKLLHWMNCEQLLADQIGA